MSWIWELPFGRGHLFSTDSRLLDAIVGGWQVQGIYNYQMGTPLAWGNNIFNGDIKAVPYSRSQRSIEQWFNTAAGFERDNRKALSYNVRQFPNRFSGLRAPGINNWDMSILKNATIKENIKIQLRGEFLNALNHVMLNAPNADPYNTAFGTITSTRGYPRRVQLGLKLLF